MSWEFSLFIYSRNVVKDSEDCLEGKGEIPKYTYAAP